MNGVLLDQEEELLSPKEAVQCFDCGESIDEILANLDVDACHFTKRVDDEGEEPVITTGFPCYTAPSRGVLVFSIDEMKRQQALGKDVILIVDHMAFLHNLHVERGALDQPEGLIVLFPEEQGVWEGLYEHFLANLLYYSSVLLDNPTKPQITMLEGQKKIKMGNDELSEGDLVTIVRSLANKGKRVVIAGLDADYRGIPFEPMPTLMCEAEFVTKLMAVCHRCGAPAHRTQRIGGGRERVVVGGAAIYEARCRNCWEPPDDVGEPTGQTRLFNGKDQKENE